MSQVADDAFERALKERERAKKEAETKQSGGGSNSNFSYEEINWLGLEDEKDIVFRILGQPYEVRQKPTDAKLIFWSKVLNDKGSYAQIIWKTKKDYQDKDLRELDEDWFFYKFYKKVMERRFEPFTTPSKDGKKGKYVYLHEGKDAYQRISENKRPKDKYPPKVYPSQRVLLNVISRMDDINSSTAHSSILTSKLNPWTNDKGELSYFVDPGITHNIYDKIFDNIVRFRKKTHGGWNLDAVIRKVSKKAPDGHTEVDWIVRDIIEDKIEDDVRELGNADPLTASEKGYKLYDLDKLFPVASYSKIQKNFSNLIKSWDSDTGSNYYDQLLELVEKEKKEWEESKKDPTIVSDIPSSDMAEESEPVKSEPKRESVTVSSTPPTRRSSPVKEELSIEQLCKKHLPAWDSLSKVEKEFTIKGIEKFEGNVPVYKEGVKLFPCECDDKFYPGTKIQPETVEECVTCTVCAKKFSAGV